MRYHNKALASLDKNEFDDGVSHMSMATYSLETRKSYNSSSPQLSDNQSKDDVNLDSEKDQTESLRAKILASLNYTPSSPR